MIDNHRLQNGGHIQVLLPSINKYFGWMIQRATKVLHLILDKAPQFLSSHGILPMLGPTAGPFHQSNQQERKAGVKAKQLCDNTVNVSSMLHCLILSTHDLVVYCTVQLPTGYLIIVNSRSNMYDQQIQQLSKIYLRFPRGLLYIDIQDTSWVSVTSKIKAAYSHTNDI